MLAVLYLSNYIAVVTLNLKGGEKLKIAVIRVHAQFNSSAVPRKVKKADFLFHLH